MQHVCNQIGCPERACCDRDPNKEDKDKDKDKEPEPEPVKNASGIPTPQPKGLEGEPSI